MRNRTPITTTVTAPPTQNQAKNTVWSEKPASEKGTLKTVKASRALTTFKFGNIEYLKLNTKSGGLDYLLTGAIPPNPSELLMRSRTKELLDILKKSYDLIIIDSAPLLLVSDTTALLPLCDSVVYVTRSQYSEKKTFSFILNMQQRENVPPFGMVLNGLRSGGLTGSNYGYKYRYSYGYTYNYGYGYGYGSDSDGN